MSTTATGVQVHERALVESGQIGPGTRIRAFAHVMAGAVIGGGCTVCDHTYIEGDVVIGERVTVSSGVNLWEGTRIGDDVLIGQNATFTNDRFPRSRQPYSCEGITVEDGASIGAGAVLLPGVTVGAGANVAPGAVVTQHVPALAVVVGSPARVVQVLDAA